jgi:hypothetical protein
MFPKQLSCCRCRDFGEGQSKRGTVGAGLDCDFILLAIQREAEAPKANGQVFSALPSLRRF